MRILFLAMNMTDSALETPPIPNFNGKRILFFFFIRQVQLKNKCIFKLSVESYALKVVIS